MQTPSVFPLTSHWPLQQHPHQRRHEVQDLNSGVGRLAFTQARCVFFHGRVARGPGHESQFAETGIRNTLPQVGERHAVEAGADPASR